MTLMKRVYLAFLFLISCAHHQPKVTEVPSWVSSVREGKAALKIPHGQKTFYRRIAGNKDLSRDVSCDLVIETAEEDIKKEFPLFPKVPYTVEVLFYDEDHKDCAVTLSVEKKYETNLEELAHYNEKLEERRLSY